MKTIRLFLLTLSICFSFQLNAQQGINYKALFKYNNGNVIANDLIAVQFTILKGVAMTSVYQETHTPTTDANGIVIVNIGEGSVDSGDFNAIDWSADDHFLNVQINTGSGLTDMGTTQFMAVPYALSAANAASKIDDLSDGRSDNDGSDDGSSIFLGVDAGLNDDGTDNRNTGIGFNALQTNISGALNTVAGSKAMHNNISGNSNTAFGLEALFSNTTTGRLTAFGYKSLFSNTDGEFNTATGYEALFSNSTGSYNTANGYQALLFNTEGSNNTANGYRALFNNTIGDDNTANGHEALFSNTTGYGNTANGSFALYSNTTGYFNTAFGREALPHNTTGFGNTAIGWGALSYNTTGSNNTAIGYNALVPDGTQDNQVRIGNTSVVYAGVQVAWTVTSDESWKKDIAELPYGLNMVTQLKPVHYIRKNNDKQTREMGFIAQDVKQVLKELGYDDQGFLTKDYEGRMSLRYNDLIAVLTKAVQEQQEIIEKQDKNYGKLLKRVEQLELAIQQ